jgi:hypothetical protein
VIAMLGLEEIRGTDPARQHFRGLLHRVGCGDEARRCSTQVHRKPWVARLLGVSPDGGFVRKFIDFNRDYRDAVPSGKRGVMLWFVLQEGIYEANEILSVTRDRRRYVRSIRGSIVDMNRPAAAAALRDDQKAVQAWLKSVPTGR